MKKMINIKTLSILTVLNILVSLYFLGSEYIVIVLFFFLCVMANQFMLFEGARNLLEDQGNKKKAIIFLTSKLFILVFAFWCAMHYSEKYIYIFIGNYIFQLIILSLSIKNDTKNFFKEGT